MRDLLILGDIFLRFKQNPNILQINDYFSDELLGLLKSTSFCVVNLESPFTNSNDNILKNGPNLKTNPEYSQILNQLNLHLVNLCNNHIKDFGVKGINDTIDNLKNIGIGFFGICSKDNYDGNFHLQIINGKKIGFYTTCENEFSGYIDEEIGANVLELPRVLSEIECYSKQCDYLIVLFHGGMELYRYPTPFQQNICRAFIDGGANIVICQHSHCVGCEEQYSGGTIVYGQGNFYFGASDIEEYKTSMLVSLSFAEKISIEYIPIYLRDETIDIAKNELQNAIIDGFKKRSKELLKCGADQLFFDNKILNNYDFLYVLFNKGKWYSRIDRHIFKCKLIKRYAKKNKRKVLSLVNFFKCETHREYVTKELESVVDTLRKK